MQTFCTEGLTISENNTIYFKPDYKLRQQRTYTFISFLNVPLETEEKEMDSYVKQYCSVHRVHYPYQTIKNIKHHTATRVYRVSNITKHFPKADHIFGRWVWIIYDGQPDRRKQQLRITTKFNKMNQNEPTISDSPHIIKEMPSSQMPEPPTDTQPTYTLLQEYHITWT